MDRGGAARDVQSDTGLYFAPRLSPDGKRVAVGRWTDINFSAKDVWVLDLAQHTRTRLTFDTTAAWPAWSRDGRRVAYQRGSAIYWVPADGSGAPDSLVTLPGQWFPGVFEPGGRGLVYHGTALQQAKGEVGRVGIVPPEAAHRVLGSTFHNYDPSLSPDGRWMAYMSDESGRFEVYVRPYPGPGGRWQVSLDGGTEPVWSPTGTRDLLPERRPDDGGDGPHHGRLRGRRAHHAVRGPVPHARRPRSRTTTSLGTAGRS